MAMKKHTFKEDEIAIFDEAVVYKRGDYWQMRMWLSEEKKYARRSLKTKIRSTAIDTAKKYYHEIMTQQLAGKRYFSLTAKQGVENFLKHKEKKLLAKKMTKGRQATIKTHLEHWLDFIGRDTKLKDLNRKDCEDYYEKRNKTKKKIKISPTTAMNEQSTINAMMKWLYKEGEAYIDAFDFDDLPKVDRGLDVFRRQTFTDGEVLQIHAVLNDYISEAMLDLSNNKNVIKALAGCYFGVALNTGLRSGEQRQLKWSAVEDIEHGVARKANKGKSQAEKFDLMKLTVHGKTSKVRKTRQLIIKDRRKYFTKLEHIAMHRTKAISERDMVGGDLVFSYNGKAELTKRQIGYHFDKIIKYAGINVGDRNLVPYSTRHYFITQRINSGLDLMSVAELAGTSAVQIERTYYHTSEEKMMRNALMDYEVTDGVIVVSDNM